MKNKWISVILCILLTVTSVSFVFPASTMADTSAVTTVFVSEGATVPSEIPSELVYASIPAAVNALKEGGTVYVVGATSMPNGLTSVSGDLSIAVKGYPNTNAKITFPTSGTKIYGNLSFDNITLKGAPKDESWTRVINGTVHFGKNCGFELSDSYTLSGKSTRSGIYIGISDSNNSDSRYIFDSPAVEYNMVAPVGLWSGKSYTLNGNTVFDMNDGIFGAIIGAVRNGNSGTTSYQVINGDVTYNMEGGNYSQIITNSINGGYLNGNLVFNINGGQFASNAKIYFGNSSDKIMSSTLNSADYSSIGNLAVIFDGKKLSENGSTSSNIEIVEKTNFADILCDNSMLIFNHAENTKYLPRGSVPSATYLLKVVGGSAIPVFEPSDKKGGVGDFLGFDIISDKHGHYPYVNGKELTLNSNGYYEVPQNTNGAFTEISFVNALEGQFFDVTFVDPDNSSVSSKVTIEGNHELTLPVCEFEKSGFSFVGWETGGKVYASGESFVVNKDCKFSALWMKDSLVTTIYVNGNTGSNDNSGASAYAPVKDISSAIAKVDLYSASKLVVMSHISGHFSIPASTKHLTITAKDGSNVYDGSLTVTSASSVKRPVTFEYMGLGCNKFQFIATGSSKVIFGKGLTTASDLEISAHLGGEYSPVESVDVEIKSGYYNGIFLGGGYFTKPSVAITGDAKLSLSEVRDLNLSIGFDGYEGYDADCSIGGSVELTIYDGNVSTISTPRLSGISGGLFVIAHNSAIVPDLEKFPEAENGNYMIRVLSDGTVTAATDDDGNIVPGRINAVCNDATKAVRLTYESGTEYISPQGDISISEGTYSLDFIEISNLKTASFTVTEPIADHPANTLYFATNEYSAVGKWYSGDTECTKFAQNTSPVLKITLTPNIAVDTTGFTSATVNGKSASVSKNDDGTFTISYTFPKISQKYVKYVSEATGSDTNSGIKRLPYKTLSKAISSLASTGGVIYICDSTNVSGTLGSNAKPILITGEGYPEASVYLNNNAGSMLGGELIFDNLTVTMGNYTHFNDKGHTLTFTDSVTLKDDSNVTYYHTATYAASKSNGANVTVGENMTFDSFFVGGAYHSSSSPTIAGDLNLNINGIIKNFSISSDSFQDSHVNAKLDGNILVTMGKNGVIKKIIPGGRPLVFAENSVTQIIFNHGNSTEFSIDSNAISKEKLYVVYSQVGGRVLHAKDENGRSISEKFDVIPDKGHYAIIRFGSTLALSAGGRYSFPAGTRVDISYLRSDFPIENYQVELFGGTSKDSLFSIDGNGCIHFDASPLKNNYLFEGWYSDKEFTQLVSDGDYIGSDVRLYAKYMSFPVDDSGETFVVRGVQMRIPDTSGNIQGLRFITLTDNKAFEKISDFSEKNSDMLRHQSGYASYYGTVVIPSEMLGEKELTLDGTYYHNGKTYTPRSAKGINIFKETSDKTEYTVCLLNINEDKYEYGYTVRPYFTYYTRSGNLSTFYGKAYSSDIMKTTFAALESGKESDYTKNYLRENILTVYADKRGIDLIPADVIEYINDQTELYKQNVLNSANMDLSHITGTKYYVSADGSDSNNGKSPDSPWKTIAKVNSGLLRSGDVVLFRRGDEFRGKIVAVSGVTYTAYGTGAKPIINGSKRDYADPSLWEETDVENVWMLKVAVSDVGLVALDHSKEIGVYDELMGTMRVSGVSYNNMLFVNHHDLDTDLYAYSNLATNTLYLYSAKGNHGSRFKSIELGEDGALIRIGSCNNVTVDNIDFRYGGGHGVSGSGGLASYNADGSLNKIGGSANLTVTNCLFSWIGGSNLSETTRYGNAVEIFGSVNGYYVENNWIYQIYDTAVTHQISGASVGNTHMRDILYKNNLLEYCHWSIEFYNQNCECCSNLDTPNHSRIVEDVLSEGNIVRMGGYGWGSRIRKDGATLYNSFGLSRVKSETRNFHAKNNIFFRCTGGLYRIYANASEDNLTFESNIWVQDFGGILAWYKNKTYRYQGDIESYFVGSRSHLKEVNNRGVYYYAP